VASNYNDSSFNPEKSVVLKHYYNMQFEKFKGKKSKNKMLTFWKKKGLYSFKNAVTKQ